MHANLVGSARMQGASDQSTRTISDDHIKGGFGLLTCAVGKVDYSHSESISRIPPDGRFNITMLWSRPMAICKCQILAGNIARGNHFHQCVHRSPRPRHHHQPTGVFVEPVHDSGSGQKCSLWVKCQQSVQQCPSPIARRRMDNQTNRLIEDQQVFVAIDYFEVYRFRLEGLTLQCRPEFNCS